jgi:hypothetical protein
MLVRPMAPVRAVDSVDQAGGYSSCTKTFQEALVTPLGPGTKTTSKTQTEGEEKPSQNLAKHLETYHELTINTTSQNHTDQVVHPRQIPQGPCTSQTGQGDQ